MGEHSWVRENVDGGPPGDAYFWVCSICHASGGPVMSERGLPTIRPFFAGMGFNLPRDCDEARKAITAFKLTTEYKNQQSFHTFMEADAFVGYLKQFGVVATVDYVGRVSGGIPGAVRVEGIQEISKAFLLSPGKDSEDTCEDPGWIFRTPGPGQLPYDIHARGYEAVTRLFDAYFG